MKNEIITDFKRFNYLNNEIESAYHEASLKLGLSDSAMIILYTVCNNGENCPLSDIYHLSGISKQTINSAVRKLEKDEIIYLRTAYGRKKTVYLTDKGKILAENTVLKIIEIENEIFGSWSAKERKLYIELTQRYLEAFKNKTAILGTIK